jgi:hypothetical protein
MVDAVPEPLENAPRPQAPLPSEPFQRWNPRADGGASAEFHRTAAGILARFPGVADFEFRPTGVACHPVPGAGQAWRTLYSQQVRPLLLAHRGEPVFHGGAVVVDGGAVVFLAPSGRGKSTLTTAFARRGMPFLGDDCVHLSMQGEILVLPQEPFMRLWDDSLEHAAPAQAARISGRGSPKPRVLSGESLPHCAQPRPLRAVYLLDIARPGMPGVRALSPAEAVMGWTANAFMLDIKDRATLGRTLATSSRLAHACHGRRLSYPRDYAMLDAVVETVLADLEADRRG